MGKRESYIWFSNEQNFSSNFESKNLRHNLKTIINIQIYLENPNLPVHYLWAV